MAREAQHAAHGRPARIIAKMNALLDKNIIQALYRASQAGVEIDLIIRGMCSLRPGIPGVSERIRVRSIVGRMLEHSRIFYFANSGQEEIYLSSADWMPRNLYERVEMMFPVRDPMVRQRVLHEILEVYLADTLKARLLQPDGSYARPPRVPRSRGFEAQEFLIGMAEGKQTLQALAPKERKPRAGKRQAAPVSAEAEAGKAPEPKPESES